MGSIFASFLRARQVEWPPSELECDSSLKFELPRSETSQFTNTFSVSSAHFLFNDSTESSRLLVLNDLSGNFCCHFSPVNLFLVFYFSIFNSTQIYKTACPLTGSDSDTYGKEQGGKKPEGEKERATGSHNNCRRIGRIVCYVVKRRI